MKKCLALFTALLTAFPAGIININAQDDATTAKTVAVTGNAVRPAGPAWTDNAVFYQIYPQTFYDSNGDGVGDIKGIIEKLDYVKSLGISAIWLNPFYESPFRDAGYDVSDFYRVAPRYGTNDDAKRLFDEVHKRGMHILIDYVPSYTSIDHPWFKASCDPKPNKYTNWYVWTGSTWFPGMDKYRAGFIQGYCERDGMFMNNFFWHQPALNYGYARPDPQQPWQLPVDHPDVMAMKEEMRNVMRFWLDMGCDGFRADMAGALVKNDDGSENSRYWKSVREFLDREYPGTFLISEWSNPKDAVRGGFNADFFHWFSGYDDLFQKEHIRNQGNNGHSFFDAEGKGDITHFLDVYMEQYKGSRELGYISVPVGNHDLERIKNHGRTDRDMQVIFAFMLTMPGTPFIYYGDEIGMKQLYSLPYTEGSYMGRAGDRTPMQWNNSPNKGFSAAEPVKLYRAVDSSDDAPDVASMEQDPNSLLNKIKELVRLRSTEPALAAYAEFVPVYAEKGKYPFAFIRANGKERLLVVVNPASRDETATFAINYKSKKPGLISGEGVAMIKDGTMTVDMKGVSYAIFRMNEAK
ncbi:MAG TPA: alpha-amylase family glycosyl hydrolase [Bacteroidales bacterium]|jgi:glycosidase|nr:alpha-amylase family glycosyl hydrolase [Bacteroidales bacterium]